MKIGVYAGKYSPLHGGGYTLTETVKREIIAAACQHEICIFYDDDNSPERYADKKIIYVNLAKIKKSLIFKIQRKFCRLFGRYDVNFDWLMRREKIDLLWILVPYGLKVTIPYVFTVWDLGHRTLPFFPEVSENGAWAVREEMYQQMLYRAAYVITGNETGKREILENYPLNPDKIKVLPFPIPDFCFQPVQPKEQSGVKQPFVFYPAQLWPHKNHIVLIEAVAWLRDKKNIIVNCYFVGSDKGKQKVYLTEKIKEYDLTEQVFWLGFVDATELLWLYKNALAMTYVSLLGPNNLPPLEAAALGCPLIISNIPGHIEQIGETGLQVNASDPQAVGAAIELLYKQPEKRRQLIARGLALAEKYENYSYFQQMLKIIEEFSRYYKTWK
jgi:glycosyltransferase involved in cell wall biosynthesis